MSYIPQTNFIQSLSGAPTPISGTTLLMAGLAVSFTPKSTGKVFVSFSADMNNTVSNNGAAIEMRFGTGTAPTNGSALTGTLIGSLLRFTKFTANSKDSPLATNGSIITLTAGVTYWFDVAFSEDTTGTGSVSVVNGTYCVCELKSNISISQSTPANPTGSSTAAFIMMGLAGSITPKSSTKLFVIISGNFQSTAATGGAEIEIQFGTGTAPLNGTISVGTTIGNLTHIDNGLGAAKLLPFSIQGIATGLTVGTTYWIDLAQKIVNTASTSNLSNISITAFGL